MSGNASAPTTSSASAGTAGVPVPGTAGRLGGMFSELRAAGRAGLVGYLPAGYPDLPRSQRLLRTMIESGCDLVEVGASFSDPVLDGPVVARAQHQALRGGTRLPEVLRTVEAVTSAGGRAVVMSYFNPIIAYGQDAFARDLAAAGGSGVITPDLIVDEAETWLAATESADIDPIFLVAPSSPAERIALTAGAGRGFLYAAAVMGVTGARDSVSSVAPELVARCRQVTTLPIGVGLGVRNGAQAAEIAAFADAVIVGSAFVARAGLEDRAAAEAAIAELATELADGIAGAASDDQETPA
ncbi:tryptophan synthase subunit alpha [Nakamurella sp. DB0629]|uniref:Tryptophan synthase alpha chain n=2 Tax=Nakamurella aerolata TaxID=1656892 RepID=A0A849A7S6_9ACTN|nr:tryptophan synthase subunit alpha [Nakamurella aerolata]NNG34540.1 tryptophan synthase subunit alpha [Nakamurella aerolata]